jgi:DNA-binding Lrp family transcriptional regulator
MLDALDDRLLNDYQRGFPLLARPFAALGARLGVGEAEVLARYRRLARAGIVSRIGVVLRPHAAGASTLAALAVPPARLEAVAAIVSAQPEVNHNYEREHRFNLWFVLAAPTAARLEAALARIRGASALAPLALPLEKEYHIDLGFDLATLAAPRCAPGPAASLPPADRPLLAAIEEGLPLVPEPYAVLGRAVGLAETEVCATIGRWISSGVVRRFGVVVRHRALGIEANAMAVWDVPDEAVDAIGARLAAESGVTLCYRRARRPPAWSYNLYAMVHGREREAVRARIAQLNAALGLAELPHEVLFSRRCFKQCGARYAAAEVAYG